jgi:hypothetical protein
MRYRIALLALALTACAPKAEREYGYDAIMPTELADCKVFNISDGNKTLYVTRCGFETTTSWNQSCGNKCNRQYDSSVTGTKP